jgi:hypothetical protein
MGNEDENPEGVKSQEAIMQLTNRILRKPNKFDKPGSSSVFEQAEISPMPLDAVVPMANSMTKAAIMDFRRKKMRIPLVYTWLDFYLCANKGAKKFAYIMVKDAAIEQLASDVKEAEMGQDAE